MNWQRVHYFSLPIQAMCSRRANTHSLHYEIYMKTLTRCHENVDKDGWMFSSLTLCLADLDAVNHWKSSTVTALSMFQFLVVLDHSIHHGTCCYLWSSSLVEISIQAGTYMYLLSSLWKLNETRESSSLSHNILERFSHMFSESCMYQLPENIFHIKVQHLYLANEGIVALLIKEK